MYYRKMIPIVFVRGQIVIKNNVTGALHLMNLETETTLCGQKLTSYSQTGYKFVTCDECGKVNDNQSPS